MLREIAGPAGRLEALLEEPDASPRAAVVLAHPLTTHGGTMHTKAVYQSAKALARSLLPRASPGLISSFA